jgi:hypothetical protein
MSLGLERLINIAYCLLVKNQRIPLKELNAT